MTLFSIKYFDTPIPVWDFPYTSSGIAIYAILGIGWIFGILFVLEEKPTKGR